MFTVNSLKRLTTYLNRSLPNRCLLCQQGCLIGQGLCDLCLQDGKVASLCLACSYPLPAHHHLCGSCLPDFAARPALLCAYPYHHPLGQLVGAIKFQQKLSLLEPLCHTLAERAQDLWQQQVLARPDALVAVPMHKSKLSTRGFNHAVLIAHQLGKELHLPVLDDLVIKNRETTEQHDLDGAQRRANLANCFSVIESQPKQNLALVDDVITTGTTFASLTHTLQQAGHHVSQHWAIASAWHS